MDFGKFLFLYLLGRNVEYLVYRRVLDAVVEADTAADGEDSDDGPMPRISEDR